LKNSPPYLQEKSGKSPLQLLAQTCSQIGADTGSSKLLAERSNGNSAEVKASKGNKSPALVVSDVTPKTVSFKPYENKDVNGDSKAGSVISLSPTGKTSISPKLNGKSPSPTNVTKAASVSTPLAATTSARTTPKGTNSSTTPIPTVKTGLEILGKEAASAAAAAGLASLSNPAFRPPFATLPASTACVTATSSASSSSLTTGLTGSVCRDPYCRDLTCPTALYNAHMAASLAATSSLPPGYAELLYAQKLGLGLPHGLTPPPSLAPGTPAGQGPYICNWMNGREGYCGKRHTSAEELLQHLRTHTNLSTSDSAASAALLGNSSAAASASSLYHGSLFGSTGTSAAAAAAAGLHRTFGAAPSAMALAAASRFHPYAAAASKSSAAAAALSSLPPSLGGLGGLPPPPPPGAGSTLPPSLAALNAFPPSLYALYGSRLAGSTLP